MKFGRYYVLPMVEFEDASKRVKWNDVVLRLDDSVYTAWYYNLYSFAHPPPYCLAAEIC